MSQPQIYFILYRPAVPGNIGASARAMKVMGFSKLRLIKPVNHLSEEAIMFAHGSHDILHDCEVFEKYEEAVSDLDFIICTTAKIRSAKVDYISSPDLMKFIDQKHPLLKKVGIVFGTEESGLPNSIILRSNIAVNIPMEDKYPSLNLSQAVMVIAYELGKTGKSFKSGSEPQDKAEWKELQNRTVMILEQLDIKPSTPLFHRIIERLSMMNAKDAKLVHSITNKLLYYIEN